VQQAVGSERVRKVGWKAWQCGAAKVEAGIVVHMAVAAGGKQR